MRGVLSGALALVTLHTLVRYKGANDKVEGIFGELADLVDRFLDPGRPALAERAPPTATTATRPVPKLSYPAPTFTPAG